MSDLFNVYRAIHDQGFVPIFVEDRFDSRKLVQACVDAGFKCIEYTLRRSDAHEMIPWIRKNYPDLKVLAGSTIDNDEIVEHVRKKHPQVMTIDALAQAGVDGFVSMIGWGTPSIRRFSKTHLIIPLAMTVNEAFEQIIAGAQFVKLVGPDVSLVKRCRADAAFGYCPIMVTGGMTPETISSAVSAGAVLIGTGFDLMLKGQDVNIDVHTISAVLKKYQAAVLDARAAVFPQLSKNPGDGRAAWLSSLPHYHSF